MTTTEVAPALTVGPHRTLRLRVTETKEEAHGIRSLVLAAVDSGQLPGYPPGSHLVLACGERRNAYSLTGVGLSPDTYTISVLLCPEGKGGSRWVHQLAVGDEVAADPPRSAFAPVSTARHHLLVAGGIGITPLLSHARAAARWGRPFRLLYGYRPGAGAHLVELRELCGGRLEEFDDTTSFVARLQAVLASSPMGTHLYACGPAAMLETVTRQADALGWPAERVHLERFSSPALTPGDPFEAVLARSGRHVTVPAGVSLLDALEDSGLAIPNLCRQGVCGECRVGVVSGRPQHRDLFLSSEEKAAADSVMCCVSRSEDPYLELDL